MLQDVAAGPTQPVIFTVRWAHDGSTRFLIPVEKLYRLVNAVGFQEL